MLKSLYVHLPSFLRKPTIIHGSEQYWKERYKKGYNSGIGSYGKFAEFKASVINDFVKQHNIKTVIEFGCGDGNQLSLSAYNIYYGYDVSESAIMKCKDMFISDTTKTFELMHNYRGEKGDLALSLDVIYHLIEDDTFENYMRILFGASNHYVIIYSSNLDDDTSLFQSHVKHRKFTEWVKINYPQWELISHIPNKFPYEGDYTKGSFADFYIYSTNCQ